VRTEISTMNSICPLKFFCILGLGISQSILYLTQKRGRRVKTGHCSLR
jgi:hypothetical protein